MTLGRQIKQAHNRVRTKVASNRSKGSVTAIREHSLNYDSTKYRMKIILDAMKSLVNLRQNHGEDPSRDLHQTARLLQSPQTECQLRICEPILSLSKAMYLSHSSVSIRSILMGSPKWDCQWDSITIRRTLATCHHIMQSHLTPSLEIWITEQRSVFQHPS